MAWRNLSARLYPDALLPFRESPDAGPLAYPDAQAGALAQRYIAEYRLESLFEKAERTRKLETLAFLEWLERFHAEEPLIPAEVPECLGWLDVGARNWSYVEALYRFAERHAGPAFRLDGVELDAGRRYRNLRSRGQAAAYYIRQLPNARYHAGDVMRWQEPAHVITHFLPFVFEDPLLAWGLPLAYFRPAQMLAHLLGRLAPGGVMLLLNQGEAETEAQGRLLAEVADRAGIRYKQTGMLPDTFRQYRYARYGWICKKDAHPRCPKP